MGIGRRWVAQRRFVLLALGGVALGLGGCLLPWVSVAEVTISGISSTLTSEWVDDNLVQIGRWIRPWDALVPGAVLVLMGLSLAISLRAPESVAWLRVLLGATVIVLWTMLAGAVISAASYHVPGSGRVDAAVGPGVYLAGVGGLVVGLAALASIPASTRDTSFREPARRL